MGFWIHQTITVHPITSVGCHPAKPLPHNALPSSHFFFNPADCKSKPPFIPSHGPIFQFYLSSVRNNSNNNTTMIRNNKIRNHQRPFLKRAPTFSAFARSGRKFGNDISNRSNKRPNDALANATKNKPVKRVSWSLDTKDPGHYQPLAATSIANRNGNRDGNATIKRTITATATAPESLANLPYSTTGKRTPR